MSVEITGSKLDVLRNLRVDSDIKAKSNDQELLVGTNFNSDAWRQNAYISILPSSTSTATTVTGAWIDGANVITQPSISLTYDPKKLKINYLKYIGDFISAFLRALVHRKSYKFIMNVKMKFLNELDYKDFVSNMEKYEKLIEVAKKNKQEAMYEKLEDQKLLFIKENILFLNGIKQFIEESDLVKKMEKYNGKELFLTYLKNFCRIIPPEVSEVLEKVIQLNMFDNILILHYDKTEEGEKLTKKEVEAKKDPIMFGAIKGSSKLYFICDWIDEYCDLTLEKLQEITKIKVYDLKDTESMKKIDVKDRVEEVVIESKKEKGKKKGK